MSRVTRINSGMGKSELRPGSSRLAGRTASPRMGSIQCSIVGAREVHHHVLCVASVTPGYYEYVNVLQVEGISYDLKSEEEQRLLNDQFQALLCALSYPVQILWRVLPLNLTTYLRPFSAMEKGSKEELEKAEEESIWENLASSHVSFLQQIASQRTLLDRHIYLIVRVGGTPAQSAVPWHATLWRQVVPGGKTIQRQRHPAEQLECARQELDLRFSELSRLLSNMNLSVCRLSGRQELIPFYYSCLMPRKAVRYPLAPAIIDGLDCPVQVGDRSGNIIRPERARSASVAPETEKGELEKQLLRSEQADQGRLSCDFAQLVDLLAPAAITIGPDYISIEEEYARIIVVHQLPRMVAPGWLAPLADLDEPMEISFHFQPCSSSAVVRQFRRRQTDYRSSRLLAQRKGNEVDPHVKIAAADVDDLIERLASGEERMLEISMHILLRGASKRELQERTDRLLSILQNMLMVARVATFEQEKAFRSCLPHAFSMLNDTLMLDSRSTSTMFPFLSRSLFHADGVLEGITPQGDPVVLDAWSKEMANANRMILGPPGWGKSHQVKSSIMRMALKYNYAHRQLEAKNKSFQVIVIDPEREYGRMATALGGQIVRLAPGSQHHLNPFDLPSERGSEEQGPDHIHVYPVMQGDRLADHVQKLHTLLELMLADRLLDGSGKLTANEKGLLDRALYETYRRVGVTSDRQTHTRPAPLMRDLHAVLESSVCGIDTTGLTSRLRRYVHGSLSGLFSGPTDVSLENAVVVFDIHDLETELRPIGLFLVANYVWTASFQSHIPRQLIVDEAATLYQYESGAIFLEDLVRRARKHYLGVTILSQHPSIFRESAIPANCATHILMRQDSTTLDLMSQMFKLSSRELQLLRRLPIGEALMLTCDKRLHVRFEASSLEHLLATTDPRELANWQHDSQQQSLQPLLQRLLAFDPNLRQQERGQQDEVGLSKKKVRPRSRVKGTEADRSIRIPATPPAVIPLHNRPDSAERGTLDA